MGNDQDRPSPRFVSLDPFHQGACAVASPLDQAPRLIRRRPSYDSWLTRYFLAYPSLL
ncbi:MAG: hypothetical protein BMS9Abin28_1868 [Anaerolineae bacterium]|nr:MAG: hypothetical protein BMS9Abin28_1868 [Anaerolineae bacterium]